MVSYKSSYISFIMVIFLC